MIRFGRRSGVYPQFSNFWASPVTYEGITYQCNEGAFQAMKCINPADRVAFANLNGSQAKALGRRVVLRLDWESVKYQIMLDICREKFKHNAGLATLLVRTGDEVLVEDTTGWHDNIWGWCTCPKCADKEHQNWLGKILMQVRSECKACVTR